jgi:hypothetical protein
MERYSDGAIELNDIEVFNNCSYSSYMNLAESLNTLKAYEDTGLTPEEIRENSIAFGNDRAWFFEQKEKIEKEITSLKEQLKEYEDAEEQGLLIKLPCKVGGIVYVINSCKQICERICCGFSLYTDMKLKIWYRWKCEETRMSNAGIPGIDVFLTKEEALKRQ